MCDCQQKVIEAQNSIDMCANRTYNSRKSTKMKGEVNMVNTEKLESFHHSIKLRSYSGDRKEVWMDITATNLETELLNSIMEELRKTAGRISEILAGHE